ncbi:MAG: hypothetical protein HKN45_05395 [Flavobacteriales bacterium]|nr:hypothetical protein [Flavobacteriales bacterium]
MIKFFRHIRQRLLSESKFSKYLLYAIGEIILVVIGILLALQINNWNTQRLNTDRNHDLLIKLSSELDLNIDRAAHLDSGFKGGFSDRFIFTDSLMNQLDNNMLASHLDYAVSQPIFFVNTFNLNSSVFEELKNTGSLYAIGTDSLVKEIQRYYQLCDRESFYNLNYSEGVNSLKNECREGWADLRYLYLRNPEEAEKYHPWINEPRSPHYIHFRQYVHSARGHSRLMSGKLKRIIRRSEELKDLIDLELTHL